ncbi:MAG: hypothetical protein K0R51_3573 [Cytophagaceae bacterium]|nr:hypothetical protein [Cytophagaceae bacterium]
MEEKFTHLVLVLHGYTLNPKKYDLLKKAIEEAYPKAHVVIPQLPFSALSMADLNKESYRMLIEIEKGLLHIEKVNKDVLPKIVIIGHSTGSLVARKVYVYACGENEDAPFENVMESTQPRLWVSHVDRIILLAGMNRGWSLTHHLYVKTAFLMRVGIVIGKVMKFFGNNPLGFQTRKGSSFITQLRLQWLSMIKHATEGKKDTNEKGIGNALVVQLLGTIDDLIPPEDNVDLVTGSNFIYLDVRMTGHLDVIQGDKTGTKKFAMETSTYGYFPMLPFLLAHKRQSKVEWLMDQYVENRAQYPKAQFSFLGHSNGTYLLAKALNDYPACKFKNVVFAGSVVSQNYNWKKILDQEKRIENVFNFVASSDWVVAMFPKTFQTMKLQDIGSGGFDGFNELSEHQQMKFVEGSHGAAIEEKYWDDIAHFIVHGKFTDTGEVKNKEVRSRFWKFIGKAAPWPFAIILAVVGVGIYFAYVLPADPFNGILSVLCIIVAIGIFVTRF